MLNPFVPQKLNDRSATKSTCVSSSALLDRGTLPQSLKLPGVLHNNKRSGLMTAMDHKRKCRS